ncbi:MAG: ATP-binding cassette domain-containing protein [Myxococcaceae bacterium]|nr:ATP-binding cassette domain-containing protein [Myxococcaceae bacterium]
MSLLRAAGVTVRGRLAPVSLELSAGMLVALVGPNGAGKSTFLDCVLGLVPFEGALELSPGTPLALVPQRLEPPALPVTVNEFLASSRTARPAWLGTSRAVQTQVSTALERVGLTALGERPLGSLSGGELRRVLLADALSGPPGVLLLDEPEAGLDATSVSRLHEALGAATRAGHAVLWVSHDAAAVQRLATHVHTLQVPGHD